jgi:hypothetical protein
VIVWLVMYDSLRLLEGVRDMADCGGRLSRADAG